MIKKIRILLVNILSSLFVTLALLAITELTLRFLPSPIRSEFQNQKFNREHKGTLSFTKDDPHLGRANIAHVNTTVERWEYQMEVRINSKGLRGEEKNYDRGMVKHRILFLGDSFTFGTGVSEEEAFVSLIDKKITPDGEAINGGIPGASTADQFQFLKGEGIEYKPDWVILCIFQNDIRDNIDDALVGLKPTQKSDLATLFFRVIGKINFLLDELFYGRSSFYATATYLKRTSINSYRITETEFKLTQRWLDQIKEFLQAQGVSLAIVYIPRREELSKSTQEGLAGAFFESHALDNRIPFLNLWTEFRKRSNASTYYYALDTHLTPAGHQAVAGLIVDFFNFLLNNQNPVSENLQP